MNYRLAFVFPYEGFENNPNLHNFLRAFDQV